MPTKWAEITCDITIFTWSTGTSRRISAITGSSSIPVIICTIGIPGYIITVCIIALSESPIATISIILKLVKARGVIVFTHSINRKGRTTTSLRLSNEVGGWIMSIQSSDGSSSRI